MLKGSDWQFRTKKMGLPIELVEKINKSSGEQLHEAENELESIIKDVYVGLGSFISRARDGYHESWDKVIEEFSATVEKVSEPWFFDEYIIKNHTLLLFCQIYKALLNRWRTTELAP